MTTTPLPPEARALTELLSVRIASAARQIAEAAARSKRSDAELLALALGVGPDLGNEVRHAAGAMVADRNGALKDWPAPDVERAATFLAGLEA